MYTEIYPEHKKGRHYYHNKEFLGARKRERNLRDLKFEGILISFQEEHRFMRLLNLTN
jgi:hypothetical protein